MASRDLSLPLFINECSQNQWTSDCSVFWSMALCHPLNFVEKLWLISFLCFPQHVAETWALETSIFEFLTPSFSITVTVIDVFATYNVELTSNIWWCCSSHTLQALWDVRGRRLCDTYVNSTMKDTEQERQGSEEMAFATTGRQQIGGMLFSLRHNRHHSFSSWLQNGRTNLCICHMWPSSASYTGLQMFVFHWTGWNWILWRSDFYELHSLRSRHKNGVSYESKMIRPLKFVWDVVTQMYYSALASPT